MAYYSLEQKTAAAVTAVRCIAETLTPAEREVFYARITEVADTYGIRNAVDGFSVR